MTLRAHLAREHAPLPTTLTVEELDPGSNGSGRRVARISPTRASGSARSSA
jgi:hypothetical protein